MKSQIISRSSALAKDRWNLLKSKLSQPPGHAIYLGEPQTKPVKISAIIYDEHSARSLSDLSIEEIKPMLFRNQKVWIELSGVHDADKVVELSKLLNINNLIVEDILNTSQRPKVEHHEQSTFVVADAVAFTRQNSSLRLKHFSIFAYKNVVVTFLDQRGDTFRAVKNRILEQKGKIRRRAADYLIYAILDNAVDQSFIALERWGLYLEDYEDEILSHTGKDPMKAIHQMRRNLLVVRRKVLPLREIATNLKKESSDIFSEDIDIFLSDLLDHSRQLYEHLNGLKDTLKNVMDLYLSMLSFRMNEVMKVLTIFASIFIPLTFIVGIYGMNFQHMPELAWEWSYPAVWLVMIVVASALVYYFRKKRWIGS